MKSRDGAPQRDGLLGRAATCRTRSGLWSTLLRPPRADLGRRNRLSNFAFFVLAAAGGSAASVVAVLLAGWSLISLGAGRFRPRIERSDLPVILSCLLFFLAIAGSNLGHAAAGEGGMAAAWRSVGERLLFLLPVLLVARMRCSQLPDTLFPAFLGAAVGGLILVPVCFLSLFYEGGGRIAGLAGNPGPFSMMALLAAGWALLSLPREPGVPRLALALIGVAGASLAVFLSGMRGSWPALPLVILIAAIARRGELAFAWRRMRLGGRVVLLALLVLALAAGVYLVAPLVALRFGEGLSDLSKIAANVDTATSLNLRRAMYEAASEAIAARPWFGYGQEAHWAAVGPYLDSRAFAGFSFTHLHNVFLTVGVEAGIVGLAALVLMIAAPLWTAFAARGTAEGAGRLAAALILVAAFLIPGLSNIMFFHDILDSVWVFAVSLIAASVPPASERRA